MLNIRLAFEIAERNLYFELLKRWLLDAMIAAAVYLMSCMVVDEASPVERAYLDQLRDTMKLDQGLADQIRAQINV